MQGLGGHHDQRWPRFNYTVHEVTTYSLKIFIFFKGHYDNFSGQQAPNSRRRYSAVLCTMVRTLSLRPCPVLFLNTTVAYKAKPTAGVKVPHEDLAFFFTKSSNLTRVPPKISNALSVNSSSTWRRHIENGEIYLPYVRSTRPPESLCTRSRSVISIIFKNSSSIICGDQFSVIHLWLHRHML